MEGKDIPERMDLKLIDATKKSTITLKESRTSNNFVSAPTALSLNCNNSFVKPIKTLVGREEQEGTPCSNTMA